jgi:hypothetical protein
MELRFDLESEGLEGPATGVDGSGRTRWSTLSGQNGTNSAPLNADIIFKVVDVLLALTYACNHSAF